MKLLILANNCQWNSWDTKINFLKDWFAQNPVTALDVTLKHATFQNIPFSTYVSNDPNQNKLGNLLGILPSWYDQNVSPLASGYDIVLFVLPRRQWQEPNNARGWRADRTYGAVELQIACDETELFNDPTGHFDNAFFQLARHEIIHSLFMISGQTDTTHYWWDRSKLVEALKEIKLPVAKITDQARTTLILKALELLLKAFNLSVQLQTKIKNDVMTTVNKKSRLEDWAKAIQQFEGWYPGSVSYRNNNPGNLRYSPFETGKNKGFSVFKTYEEGFKALVYQLNLAATGRSKVYQPTMSLLAFFSVYAPSSDNNHPQTYAKFVADKLAVDVETLISTLA